MPNGWCGDLSAVMARIGQLALGSKGWVILRGGSRLALALPRDRRAAQVIISLYQPHRWTGRAFRLFAKTLVATGLHGHFAKIFNLSLGSTQVTWLNDAAIASSIGFLGANPAHGPRCIIGGIDPTSREIFVAKLGLDQSADAIKREHNILVRLHGKYPGVINALGIDQGSAWALLRLPHLGEISPKKMLDPGVVKLFDSWRQPLRLPLSEVPWAKNLIQKIPQDAAPSGWHERMLSLCINTALIHGDFAVWNTRNTIDGLVALDWEWAEEHGIAGIDLAHGLRQECYMVQRMSPKNAVHWMLYQATLSPWREYLETSGWTGDFTNWLRLGLLHSHFNALNPSAELLTVLGINLKI